MNFSTVPTDNLYKFCAILGVLLYTVFPHYLLQQSSKLEIKGIRLKAELVQLKDEYENLHVQVGELSKHGSSQDASRLLEVTQELGRKRTQLFAASDEYRVQSDYNTSLVESCRRAGIAGAILMILGFSGWLFRIQLPQDRLLKLQALELNQKHVVNSKHPKM